LIPERKKFLKDWTAALLWIGVIAIESTEWLSSEHTGRFLYPILHFLFNMSPQLFAVVHHYLRKMGHFVGYFALSVFLFRAWRDTLHPAKVKLWARRWAGSAFLMSVLVASLDEWHQTFLPAHRPRRGCCARQLRGTDGTDRDFLVAAFPAGSAENRADRRELLIADCGESARAVSTWRRTW